MRTYEIQKGSIVTVIDIGDESPALEVIDHLGAKLAAAELEAFAAKERAYTFEKDKSDMQLRLKRATDTIAKIDCECGGEEPDGSSPTCYRCVALDKLKND